MKLKGWKMERWQVKTGAGRFRFFPVFIRAFTASILISILLPWPAAAQDGEISWTRVIDWEKGEMTLTLSAALARTGPNRPAAAITAERRIDTSLSKIFSEALLPLQIDSTMTFVDSVETGVFTAAELLSVAQTAKKGIPRYSQDMQTIFVDYTYRLYDSLAPYFIRHSQPREIPHYLAWFPTREYTGIVIYAGKNLPVHGEAFESPLVPCLFPELFDAQTNPLFSIEMGDPAYLKRWGSAAYTSSFDETPWRDRIGDRPLRIIAAGLYGKYPTDLKIDMEDAALILALPANRRLLAEGRILIIFDPPAPEF
ncbi:MAG: hypothetical protein LBK13_07120 [Spirochaetales bacterium]|jgi:hypothetical protein|nr:hypothetical protein [Spirochaetales bacterium]